MSNSQKSIFIPFCLNEDQLEFFLIRDESLSIYKIALDNLFLQYYLKICGKDERYKLIMKQHVQNQKEKATKEQKLEEKVKEQAKQLTKQAEKEEVEEVKEEVEEVKQQSTKQTPNNQQNDQSSNSNLETSQIQEGKQKQTIPLSLMEMEGMPDYIVGPRKKRQLGSKDDNDDNGSKYNR